MHREPKYAPAAVDGLIQHLEMNLHRIAWEITLEMQCTLGLVERRRLRQLFCLQNLIILSWPQSSALTSTPHTVSIFNNICPL